MVALENVDVLRKNGFEVVSQSTDQDDSPRLALDSQPISRETVFDFRGQRAVRPYPSSPKLTLS